MKILIDLDGVVADFVAGAMELHDKEWPFLDPEMKGNAGWDFYKSWGLTSEEFWRGMDRSFWAELPLLPWADDLVTSLEELAGMENLCFVTSPAHHPGCMEGKVDWCEAWYPGIPVILTRSVKNGAPPKHFLAHEGALLIDDYERNVSDFVQAGGRALLFPQPWNYRHEEYAYGNSCEFVCERVARMLEETANAV